MEARRENLRTDKPQYIEKFQQNVEHDARCPVRRAMYVARCEACEVPGNRARCSGRAEQLGLLPARSALSVHFPLF
jgi:hypothetical protein